MFLIEQGGIFIWPLLACSVLMVAIILERFYAFATYMKKPLIAYETPQLIMESLRRRLVVLSTIITIAPMLGLLGTVTGLMKCFQLLGSKVTIYNPQEVSLGISEALLTTGVGLVITVVGLIFYNYFSARLEQYVNKYNFQLEEDGNE